MALFLLASPPPKWRRASSGVALRQCSSQRARKYWRTRWSRRIDSPGLACRNNLDRHVHRRDAALVTNKVYVAAANISEALTCYIDLLCAGGALVHGERPSDNGNQARTRMGVPPSVSSHWERVLGDIDVRIPFHPRLELPFGNFTLATQV